VSAQNKRQHHRRGLRGDHDPLPVHSIRRDAADGREQKYRYLAGKAHRPQQQPRTGKPVHQPRLRHRLHPRADERDQLSAEEKLEVAMAQGPPHGLPTRSAHGVGQRSVRCHIFLRGMLRLKMVRLSHSFSS